LRLRELFSVALLAATGFPKQLFAHLRALVEMGEKPETLAYLVVKHRESRLRL
jgi:alkylhydroperoxidase/carboxymuconolactone decarboxylase family protein YurZ